MIFLILLCIAPVFSAVEANVASNGRIVNGQNATGAQFPWQVALYVFYNPLNFRPCEGAIISPEWILTTADCLTPFYVVAITYGLTDLKSFKPLINSYEYIIHEDFDNATMNNNIGLIHLDPPLIYDENTSAISLFSEEVEAGIEATISGFGHSKFDDQVNDMTSVLQYTSVTTLDNSECEQTYGDLVSSGTVCAIGNNQIDSPCIGDNGGPLVMNADADPVQIGIFSFVNEEGCNDQSYPSVYTRISYYREWIKEKTGI